MNEYESFDRDECEFLMGGLIGEVRYNFISRSGLILMPEMSCVDMRSAIEFFEKIDPNVTAIYTLSDNVPDMIYHKCSEKKKWTAFHCSRLAID